MGRDLAPRRERHEGRGRVVAEDQRQRLRMARRRRRRSRGRRPASARTWRGRGRDRARAVRGRPLGTVGGAVAQIFPVAQGGDRGPGGMGGGQCNLGDDGRAGDGRVERGRELHSLEGGERELVGDRGPAEGLGPCSPGRPRPARGRSRARRPRARRGRWRGPGRPNASRRSGRGAEGCGGGWRAGRGTAPRRRWSGPERAGAGEPALPAGDRETSQPERAAIAGSPGPSRAGSAA